MTAETLAFLFITTLSDEHILTEQEQRECATRTCAVFADAMRDAVEGAEREFLRVLVSELRKQVV